MWTDGSGIQQFNETTAMSYLSESLIRGSYKTSASLIRTASVNLENSLTTSTAPYLGNIVVKGNELIASQNMERSNINALINNKNKDLLQINNIINYMLCNKLESKIPQVVTLASKASSGETLSASLLRLKILTDAYNSVPEMNLDALMVDIIENTLLPSVNWLDEGLFLQNDNIIIVEDSFRVGKLLLNSGKILNNNFYLTVGKQMIISILTRAMDSAFLPEKIFIEDNRISRESGTLLPEDFYFELTENPYYTKQNNLTDILGSGSWILTSANYYDIQADGKETILSVNFPKASIHHFAIKGVKPFTRIYMHDMKWNSDPNFQRYSDGWVYDKANETLYVKLKHRVDNEQIKILYYYPETTVPETSTDTTPTGSTITTDNS
jgi:hypothetical protein